MQNPWVQNKVQQIIRATVFIFRLFCVVIVYHCPSVVPTRLSPRRGFYQILRKTKVLRNNTRWGRRAEDESLTEQHIHRHPAQVRCHPARTNSQTASWNVPTGFQKYETANRLQSRVHCQQARDTAIQI